MNNMPEIKWEEPVQDRRVTARWRETYIEAMKARPGVWALVEEEATSAATVTAWKKWGCEATSRRNPDKTFKIYARWPEQ